MKKIYITLLSLVLVFSLAACAETKKTEDTSKETAKETVAETKIETQAEENTAEKEFTSLAIKDKMVIASYEGGNLDLYTLEAADNPMLTAGHKYVFKLDPAKIEKTDKLPAIKAEKSQMLGKEIGFAINDDVFAKLQANVQGIKLVDARPAADAAKDKFEGSVNIELSKLVDNAGQVLDTAKDLLKDYKREDIIVVKAADAQSGADLAQAIYKVSKTGIVLVLSPETKAEAK